MSEFTYRPHKAICADGVTRTARIRSCWNGREWAMHGDTFFSVPAFVKAHGKTVRGFVTGTEEGLKFVAYTYRKNHTAIPTK